MSCTTRLYLVADGRDTISTYIFSQMYFIDLSRPFTSNMPVFPGDDEAKLSQIRHIPKDGYTDYRIESGMHIGTHLDAPAHMLEDGQLISQIPIEHFAGRGILLDVRNQAEIQLEKDIEQQIRRHDILLFLTGHGKRYGQADYFEKYPVLSQQFAEFLASVGVRIVGFDTPSPDTYPFTLHKLLLGANVLIMENLTNLETLIGVEQFEVYAFPIKFHADAAPVRIVAKIP